MYSHQPINFIEKQVINLYHKKKNFPSLILASFTHKYIQLNQFGYSVQGYKIYRIYSMKAIEKYNNKKTIEN